MSGCGNCIVRSSAQNQCHECKRSLIPDAKTNWQDMAPALPKGESMPMTEEYFRKHLAMVDELVMEQKDEISKLKSTVNDLRNKLGVATSTGKASRYQVVGLTAGAKHCDTPIKSVAERSFRNKCLNYPSYHFVLQEVKTLKESQSVGKSREQLKSIIGSK